MVIKGTKSKNLANIRSKSGGKLEGKDKFKVKLKITVKVKIKGKILSESNNHYQELGIVKENNRISNVPSKIHTKIKRKR